MTTDSQTPTETPTADFETALRTLVFESFADGAAVEGTWELTSSSAVVPGWRVTIEKTESGAPPDDEAAFIDG